VFFKNKTLNSLLTIIKNTLKLKPFRNNFDKTKSKYNLKFEMLSDRFNKDFICTSFTI